MISFQWLGGPTFILQCGSFRLLSDPMFGEGPCAFIMKGHPSTGEEIADIGRHGELTSVNTDHFDSIIISHLHTDHFDDVAIERLSKEHLVIAPENQVSAIKEKGFKYTRGLKWWEKTILIKDNEQIIITAVPARHAHNDKLNEEMGIVNGYVIQYSNDNLSFYVYWTGDTVWFDGLNDIKEMIGKTHLLIPHMGAVGVDGPFGRLTLDANEATEIACLFKPDFIIPIHHHTFSHYVEPIDVFQRYMRETNYADCLLILKEGETWYY